MLLPYSASVTCAFVLIRPIFIDVLANVGYLEDATLIVEARICQVFSQIVKYG